MCKRLTAALLVLVSCALAPSLALAEDDSDTRLRARATTGGNASVGVETRVRHAHLLTQVDIDREGRPGGGVSVWRDFGVARMRGSVRADGQGTKASVEVEIPL